jgi:hypothetical protein
MCPATSDRKTTSSGVPVTRLGMKSNHVQAQEARPLHGDVCFAADQTRLSTNGVWREVRIPFARLCIMMSMCVQPSMATSNGFMSAVIKHPSTHHTGLVRKL